MSSATASTTTADPSKSPLVMQLIVNEELLKDPGWSMGPMMAQAAHAATAIIAQTYSSPSTQRYIHPEAISTMRKVVLQTSEPLEELSKRLHLASSAQSDFPSHHLWIEEPEHIPTVLAIAPNTRPSVSHIPQRVQHYSFWY
jgi:peptidyl-tRNA hydrolase